MRNLITVKNSKYPKVNSYLDLYYGIYKDILNWDYYDCKNLVYLIIDKSKENSFKLLNKTFNGSPAYVGMGKGGFDSSDNCWFGRTWAHDYDLVYNELTGNPERYEIYIIAESIPINEARALEAYCIRYFLSLGYKFSLKKQLHLEDGRIMNKRRELSSEKFINDLLIIDGNNIR